MRRWCWCGCCWLAGWLVCNQQGKGSWFGDKPPEVRTQKRGLFPMQKLACKWKPWELSGHHRHTYADDKEKFNNLNLIVNLSLLSMPGWYDSMVRYLRTNQENGQRGEIDCRLRTRPVLRE